MKLKGGGFYVKELTDDFQSHHAEHWRFFKFFFFFFLGGGGGGAWPRTLYKVGFASKDSTTLVELSMNIPYTSKHKGEQLT